MFTYNGKPAIGWLHSSSDEPVPVDKSLLSRLRGFAHGGLRYHIEYDPSLPSVFEIQHHVTREHHIELQSLADKNDGNVVPVNTGTNIVTVLNPTFTVFEPYQTPDGRLYFQIIGNPFNQVEMTDAQLRKQLDAQNTKWQEVIELSKDNNAVLNTALPSQAPDYSTLSGRVTKDALMVPFAAALAVVGIAAFATRRR